MDVITETAELTEVKNQTNSLITQAQQLAVAIKDKPSYDRAADLLMYGKSLKKKIESYFKELKDPINKAKAEILKKEEEALSPVEKAVGLLGPAMSAFTQEQDRQHRIAEEKARADAKRIAEENALAAAVEAEKGGDHQMVDAILDEPIVQAPVSVPKFEEAKGLHDRTVWKAEILNLRSLIEGIIAGKVPITAIEANTTVINQAARAMKQEFNWPGIRVFAETTKVGRTF